MNEEPIEENVSLFSEPELEEIQYQQELELANISNPDVRASFRIKHQSQMTEFRSKKITIVLEHLLQYPFERKFATRLQATKYQQKLAERLQSLKQRLEKERVGSV